MGNRGSPQGMNRLRGPQQGNFGPRGPQQGNFRHQGPMQHNSGPRPLLGAPPNQFASPPHLFGSPPQQFGAAGPRQQGGLLPAPTQHPQQQFQQPQPLMHGRNIDLSGSVVFVINQKNYIDYNINHLRKCVE